MTVQIERGIDVSHWQGDIDWSLVVKDSQDIKFAFVKATGGQTVDPDFKGNVSGAEAVGLQVGAYHFATFRNKAEAIAEANFFVKSITGLKFDKDLVLDLETNRGNLNKSDLTDAVVAFLETVKNTTKHGVAIYMNKNYHDNLLDMSKLSSYGLWIARYGVSDAGVGGEELWQYADNGKVDGIKGYVDMDVEYVDESQVKASSTPSVNNATQVKKQSSSNAYKSDAKGEYTIKSGDVLGRIALGFNVKVAELKVWNKLSNVNAIKVGEKLIVKQPSHAKPVASVKYHIVKSGDTLSGIASKEKTTVKELQKDNSIKDKDFITIGERLKIVVAPVKSSTAKTPAKPSKVMHKVASGDTVGALAKHYGSSINQIKIWNNLDSKYTIYIGEEIRVK